jgi:hypothetical protein
MLPRSRKNSIENFNDCLKCPVEQNYSLYDYSIKLFAKKTSQPSITFKRQTYIDLDNLFFEKLKQKNDEYITKNNVKIKFVINTESRLLEIKFNFTKCIKTNNKIVTIRNDTHGSSRSIFNTNRIKTIPKLQKTSETTDNNFMINYQDLKPGYYENSIFKLSDLDIDIEYYKFLIKTNC